MWEPHSSQDFAADAEAWGRFVLSVSGAGVWAWDTASGKITADDTYRRLYGFSPEEDLTTQAWQARIHPDDRAGLMALVAARIEQGTGSEGTPAQGASQWHEEFRILHPELGERWMEGIGRVVRNDDGSASGLAGINRDITERKRSDIALRESEGKLRAIIDNVIDGIIAIDEHGTVDALNPAAVRLFGHGADQVIGRNVRMLMPEPYRHEHDGYISRYLDTGEAKIIGIGREVKGLRADGSVFPMELGISAIRQKGQRFFIGIVRDITERKKAEQTQRLLIDEINHRVKNTLVTVQAMAEQTMLHSCDPAHFVESFRGRLQALARAHNLLTTRNWGNVDLESMLREQLLIGLGFDHAIALHGPAVPLDSLLAVNLGLTIHELGTNARKYGALKVPDGKIAVSWRIAEGGDQPPPAHSVQGRAANENSAGAGGATPAAADKRCLELEWVERNGPPVTAPQSTGFGTRLIERGLMHALGGEAHIDYAPSGLRCRLTVPLAK